MAKPYTNKGKQRAQLERASANSPVQLVTEPSGTFTFTVDLNLAGAPERVYRAAAVHHLVGPDRIARFLFGQFRGLALKHLQSTVVIDMPIPCVQQIAASADASLLEAAIRGANVGSAPPIPGDVVAGIDETEQSIAYGAQFARMSVNAAFGGAIDFFELSVHPPGSTDLRGVIRIACSNALVLDFLDRCRKVSRDA